MPKKSRKTSHSKIITHKLDGLSSVIWIKRYNDD